MAQARDFFSLVKIGIVASNSLTAVAGFCLAAASQGQGLAWPRLGLVLGGTALLVGGACALNNWMDRDLDALMERTQDRPTARGRLGARTVLSLGFGLILAGEALLFLTASMAAIMGLAGALIYLLAYTAWAKRLTPLSSFIGGLAGAIPPLIGWAAVDPSLGGPALPLFGLLLLWQQAHVRALGLRRRGEYALAGIPLPGLSTGPGSGRARPGKGLGAERTLLVWIALLLPYPGLALGSLGKGSVLVLTSLSGLWLLAGLIPGPRSWAKLMFRLSLVWLVLAFAAMIAWASVAADY